MKSFVRNALILLTLLLFSQSTLAGWTTGSNGISKSFSDSTRYQYSLNFPNGPMKWTEIIPLKGAVDLMTLNMTGGYDAGYDVNAGINFGEGVWDQAGSAPQLVTRTDLAFNAAAWMQYQAPGLALSWWGGAAPLTVDVAQVLNLAAGTSVPSEFDFRIEAPSVNFSLPFLADGQPLATIPLSPVGIYKLDSNGLPDRSLALSVNVNRIPALNHYIAGLIGATVGFKGKIDLGLAGIDYYSGSSLIGTQTMAATGVNVSQYAGGTVNVTSRDYRFAVRPQVTAGVSPFVKLNVQGFSFAYLIPTYEKYFDTAAKAPALLDATLTLQKDLAAISVSGITSNYAVPATAATSVQTVAPQPVSTPTAPVIGSVSPTILNGLALPATQPLTIIGTGFTPSSTLEFVGGTTTLSNRVPTYISPTELRYNIKVGAIAQNWTVKVLNGSAISNAKSFSVTQMADSVAPTVAITSPTSASTYIASLGSIALSGTAIDNVGVTSVTWINNQGGSGSATVSGNTWSASSISLVSGVNVLTIRAADAAGNSSTAQLSVSYNPATPATLPSSPALQDIVTSNGNYTVAWGQVTGATMYVLEEDRDGTFIHPTSFSTTSLSLAFSSKAAGTYFYRVSAVNTSGQGPASPVKSAVVAYNQGPGDILVVTPFDGATSQPLSVTLNWSASNPGGGALRYDVYVVQAATEFFFPNNLVSQGQAGTSFTVSNLPYNTPVSWGIKATDSATGSVRYSRMFHFTTQAYTTPSTGSVSINAGAATTTSYSVMLNTTANPVANGVRQYMRFSNDGVTYGWWQNVSSMFPWNLADPNYGGKTGLTTYTVYAQFQDDQGNVSPVYTDTIDKVAGTAGNIILNGKLYETIQDAINAANPGETVYLTEGVFTIPANISMPDPLYPQVPTYNAGMVMRPGVALKGAGANKTTINFQNAFFGIVDADNATIEGINFVNSNTTNTTIETVLLVSSSSRIHNCTIQGGSDGIKVGWDSLHPAANSQISNNLIISNRGGIFTTPYASNISIANNTIAYNTYSGILVQDGSTTTLRNNIIAFNGSGIAAWATTALTLGNNDVYPNAVGVGYSSGITDKTGINGNISADPLFVNASAGNYLLSSGSPAVNAGANIGVPFSGSAPDMGAFEQNATGSIQLNSNQAGGSFVIAGPQASYSGSGTTWSGANLSAGLYTISFSSLPNLYSPAYQTVELLSGQTLVVTANYSADTTPPAGSVAVNFEEYATDDANISIVLDVTDAVAGMGSGAQMKFSNDGVMWSTPEPYSTLKKGWNLTAGYGGTNTSGVKTVYAMVSDALGNWATFTDTVLYVPNRQVLNVPAQYSTIQAAVNAALPGDVVQIAPGSYCENVTLLDGVTLRGSGGDKTVFQGCGIQHIYTAPNSQIEGLGGYIQVNASAGPTIIQDDIFLLSAGLPQVAVTGVGRRVIRNNIFHPTSVTPYGIGVIADGGSGGAEVVVENNSFINLNQALYLQLAQPTSRIISKNNIFASNNTGVIDTNTNDTVHKHIFSSFNTYWANISNFGTASLYRLMEAGDMNADPLFTNVATADFHLQAASTSINSGNPDARYADIDLSRNDRGAYGGQKAMLPTIPSIVMAPQSQSVAGGASVTLSVKATGSMPLAYQWSKNGADIPGATAQTIAFNNFSSSDSGIYTVTVTNQLGSITSLPAYVELNTPVVVPTYSLNVIAINGTVSKYPDRLNYQEGEVVILTAYSSTGYQFTGWSGDVSGVGTQLAITMNGNKNIIANFVTVPGAPVIGIATAGNAQAMLTFSAPANNGGSAITGYTVTSTPGGGVDSNANSTTLSHVITGLTNGTAYTFTVRATNSIGASAASAASNSVTPVAPVVTFTVSTSAGANGSITPATQTVTRGNTTSFTVTPNSGYTTASASGCGGSLTGSTYTTAAITADCTVSATFTQNIIQINLVTGWNLLGNSVNAPLPTATTFGNATNVTTVWKWIPATSKWAFYTPSLADGGAAYAATKGYDFLTAINGGEGFWVNAKTAFTAQLPAGTSVGTNYFQDQLDPAQNKLVKGWNLITTGDNVTPSVFNAGLSMTPPAQGVIPVNVTTLWAWDSALSNWYFYAPSLEANGGLASYITSKGYLDFAAKGKTLDPTTGFWVNHP